jgi:small subunit ribosomal protein S2
VADAYIEGAKRWQESVRAMGGKTGEESVEAPPRGERGPRRNEAATPAAAGPAVVKVNKGNRKLVAAGTAEDVEIQMELEQGGGEAPEADGAETSETTEK